MRKLISMLLACLMLLNVSAYASGDPSGGVTAEPAASEESADWAAMPQTAETKDVADMEPSEYAYLASFTKRDDTGRIFIGNDVTSSGAVVALDETVYGPSYTGVYAHGEDASVTVTGTLAVSDDTAGEYGSDFSGQGVMIVANDGARVELDGAAVYGDLTVNEDGTLTLTASENRIPAGTYGTIEASESASGEASGEAS